MEPETDPFPILVALWRRAEELGVKVMYQGHQMDDGDGLFVRVGVARIPVVKIGRKGYAEPLDKPNRELGDGSRLSPSRIRREVVVLAHELGHFLSSERTPAGEYARYHEAEVQRDKVCDAVPREGGPGYIKALGAAAQAGLGSKQIELILAEEQRAWDLGRELVAEFWPEAQEHYAAEEKEGLLGHRRRLGVEES